MAKTLRTFVVLVTEVETRSLPQDGRRVQVDDRVPVAERILARGEIRCSTVPDAEKAAKAWAAPKIPKGHNIIGIRFGQKDGAEAVFVRTAKPGKEPGTFPVVRTRK